MLEGGYCEAGESGRWNVEPGMLIVHARGESHADWFGERATQLVDFDLSEEVEPGVYRPNNVDELIGYIGIGNRPLELGRLEPVTGEADWPDLLAADIRRDACLPLGEWADRHGVRPETVSRGFLRAYGVSPAAYRVGVKVKAVVAALHEGGDSLAELAAEHGFADQPHMTRAVRSATGRTPTQLRQVKSIQDGVIAPL
ncbi:MAG TPA: AraC family transcriptional regulator [Sphingomicrobium sp.]|nr:AraC family transcriptional regulator [Sphingomicrobium sp.]